MYHMHLPHVGIATFHEKQELIGPGATEGASDRRNAPARTTPSAEEKNSYICQNSEVALHKLFLSFCLEFDDLG